MLSKIKKASGGTNTDQLLVVSWKKEAGDAVKRGDILLEVETDKAVLEVESFAQGTLLKRLVEVGSYGTVGDVIAYIGSPEDLTALETESTLSKPTAGDLDVVTPTERTTLATPASEPEIIPSAQADSSTRRFKATPAAKKEARDRGLNLAEVHRSIGKEILRRSDVAQFSGVSAGSPGSTRAIGDVTI